MPSAEAGPNSATDHGHRAPSAPEDAHPPPPLPRRAGEPPWASLSVADLVRHVDDDALVVCKPPGWLTVPGRGDDKQDCLWHWLQTAYPEALVVHRLDQATSGLLLFARSLDAQRHFSRAFEQRRVDKTYVALVHGVPSEDSGQIDLPLLTDWPQRPRQKVDHVLGKPASTHWHCLSRDAASGCSLLRLSPDTGRTHQLRVHLLAIGHPIVGDALYGSPADRTEPRLWLHAQTLAWPGRDGDMRHVVCPVGDDWPCSAPTVAATSGLP